MKYVLSIAVKRELCPKDGVKRRQVDCYDCEDYCCPCSGINANMKVFSERINEETAKKILKYVKKHGKTI
jgi:hypothetical protein